MAHRDHDLYTAWRLAFLRTRVLVHYLYLSTLVLNGALLLLLPSAQRLSYAEYRPVFLVFLGLSCLTFPISWAVQSRWLSAQRMEELCRQSGAGVGVTAFKLACIAAACVGDMTGIVGATFFAYSRAASGLAWFLTGWLGQYAMSMVWLARGRAAIEREIAPPAPALAATRKVRK